MMAITHCTGVGVSKILIIDDDVDLTDLFQDYLQQEGFSVTVAHTGSNGLNLALSGQFDLLILDIMLPDIKGTEILTQLRRDSRLPILMFSARGDDIDRIIGLESGADDYVPKPCTPRELVARIRAILRRSETMTPDERPEPLSTGHLQIWSRKRRASWLGQPLELTSTEFNLLETLALHAGQIVSKTELSEKALGRPLARFDRSIDVHMSSIRQKLGHQIDGSSYIQTVRGQGYQLIKDE